MAGIRMENKIYEVGMYCRLSKDDGTDNESASIATQKSRRNMMFLFAGHSDKPLKSLISMAHKGNHICLHCFSFIYVTNDL